MTRLIFAFLVLFLLLQLRFYYLKPPNFPEGQLVKITGRINQEPHQSETKQIIIFGKVKVTADQYPIYSLGDKIEVFGIIEKRVTKNKKSEFYMYPRQISVIDHGGEAPLWTKVRKALIGNRQRFERRLLMILPQPQASLLSGILLGSRQTMSYDFLQKLQTTGTIHLIAASGYNITVISGVLLSGLVFFVRRRYALFLAFFAVTAYALASGGEPAVIRALIMTGVAFLAQFLGREKNAIIALLLSGYLMLLYNPLILYDIGFQLSFAATAGILFLQPIFSRMSFFRRNFIFKEIGISLSAQIAVLPILLYQFNAVSIISLVINCFLAPLIPYIMFFGSLITFFSFVPFSFAKIAAVPSWVLLTLMVKLVDGFAAIPWANLMVTNFSVSAVLIYYFFLAIFLFLIWRNQSRSRFKSFLDI